MTSSILEALSIVEASETPRIEDHDETEEQESQQPTQEPTLDDPKFGNPISHGQIVDLWKQLKVQGNSNFTLEQLLRGASVYIPPPPPKPEPSPEYKALMARLRREEEARSYERMINPPPQHETFKDHFPSVTASFAAANRPTSASDLGDDDTAMEEVHKQITLIINFLVSIAGVAGTLWVTARWWSLPARMFLTMGGSILVAIAEVVVYNAYIWKMDQGRKKHGKVKEVREVVESWVLGKDEDEKSVLIGEKDRMEDGKRRTSAAQMAVRYSLRIDMRCASPAPSVSRSRVKPLRTYGKRSIRDDSPKEPHTKKRRVSTEAAASEPASKDTDTAPLKEVTEEVKNAPELTTTSKPTAEPAKKGSILNFFKPVPPSSTVASSPKSDEPQPESTPPSSPPQPPRIEPRKKPRLLRFRGTSTPLLDDENAGDDTQGEVTEAEDSGTKSTRPAARESSLNREVSTNESNPGKKGKAKTPTVQTTLNLSTQAAFSECKVCNTVWNPLYPDDVKFHTKQHAAVLRAKKKEKESEL
ncbi:vacuolar er assembly vma12 [Fusarium pseudocircinatum]|uniref:Vacuolar er assembly vma12 n=1 Tax=Fusarium pseudocircinatum TaxID=56676 RepID=A0A8H5KJW7_9HYPO|nr:vacuolar er assembly vma12 [Fusarium pseudocircinatum]